MTQFLREQASDSEEVVTPLTLDGTYLSRNFATLGPLTWQPPCAAAMVRLRSGSKILVWRHILDYEEVVALAARQGPWQHSSFLGATTWLWGRLWTWSPQETELLEVVKSWGWVYSLPQCL